MALVTTVRDYVLKMIQDVPGLKILLLDAETLPIVSLALSQSEILHKDVVLVEKIDSRSVEEMPHLQAVVFVRPTSESMSHLKRHLRSPRFPKYHIFFANMVSNSFLHILADADVSEVVQQVQEFYGDFYAIDQHHFTLHIPANHYCYVSATVDLQNTQRICERSVEALTALCLATKKRPVIRYQRGSEMARRVAHEASRIMYEAEKPLFDFRRTDSFPLLLVVDRRDDPLTPLLNQWTYQAMVQELIGIKDNKVDLRHVQGISDDYKEVVLSASQDKFFATNMFENFGDVGNNVAKLVDELQKKDKRHRSINTLEDMTHVLESYPEYRQQAGSVAKHVAIMTELQRVVGKRQLMGVSECEQEIVCGVDSQQAAVYEAVLSKLSSSAVSDVDKLRLVLLYSLRHEGDSTQQLKVLVKKLVDGQPTYRSSLIVTWLRQFGSSKRVSDLFGSKDLLNVVARTVKRGLTGVENVYTQHQPLLSRTIDAAAKGRLSEADFPFTMGSFQQARAQDIIVFVVGGTTYEEARAVALFNSANPGVKVVLGGTALLSSQSFIAELRELTHLEETVGLD